MWRSQISAAERFGISGPCSRGRSGKRKAVRPRESMRPVRANGGSASGTVSWPEHSPCGCSAHWPGGLEGPWSNAIKAPGSSFSPVSCSWSSAIRSASCSRSRQPGSPLRLCRLPSRSGRSRGSYWRRPCWPFSSSAGWSSRSRVSSPSCPYRMQTSALKSRASSERFTWMKGAWFTRATPLPVSRIGPLRPSYGKPKLRLRRSRRI